MVVTTDKDTIQTDNIIWAAGNKASPLIEKLGTEVDLEGRAIVNNCLLYTSPSPRD